MDTRKALRSQLESAPLLSQQISGRNLNSVQRSQFGTCFCTSCAIDSGVALYRRRSYPLYTYRLSVVSGNERTRNRESHVQSAG